ncbi:MAG: adenylate/guanylate cyclase domain-containing protein [Candidatus Competibacter sp.]|nr:adenylate/guanylate cyclase domain-containing protein [Candidatus Competibacter sp.]MDG4606256.1 adenylate/guanylate cyclase domain-containing protein [Candidatus Contendobacter sp.]HRD51002.1 adenylate/guanylate cyclase domain-containing protein [Candidatus Contendobacter sp.]
MPVLCLLISQAVFAGVLGLWHVGALQALELLAYDGHLRGQALTPPDARIVLIGETEADLRRWGYPLPDGVLAEVLERLAQGQPRVIGVDKYRDLPAPPGSERLDQFLRRHPEVVWVTKFGNFAARDPAIDPPSALMNTDQVGFSDVPVDEDGQVRRGLLFLDDGRQAFTAFALVVALRYLQPERLTPQPDPEHPDSLRLGATTIPPLAADVGGYIRADTAGYQYLLDYRGRVSAAQIYTLSDVLQGRLLAAHLSDKIVLLGAMAESLSDEFQIPVRRFIADASSSSLPATDPTGRIAGVTLHALQVNQLLRFALAGDAPIRGLSGLAERGWLWGWCMTGVGLALCRLRFRWLLLLMAGALATLAGVWQAAFLERLWLPLAAPTLGLILTAALSTVYLSVRGRAERRLLMNLFARHVAPEVADTLWRERERLVTGGRLLPQHLIATVLFADIRGFTPIAEVLEPAQLMDWLNVYMEAMTQVIMAHGGVVKQYVGDEIMALFGVPIPRQTEAEMARDAIQAVQCALAMSEQLRRLNAKWAEQGLPTIAVRIGIYTGPLVAGSLGGSQRLEYAVIGDTVNIASRLESFDKEAHDPVNNRCRVLIGETTLRYLDGRFRVTEMGRVKFKGKQQEIAVYRVDE